MWLGSNGNEVQFELDLRHWFEEQMRLLTELYKRRVLAYVFSIALALSFALNLDARRAFDASEAPWISDMRLTGVHLLPASIGWISTAILSTAGATIIFDLSHGAHK
jgi:hypothetical protein